MSLEMVIEMGRRAIFTAGLICLPPLVAALAVGFLIAIFQAVTQIHESALSFIPKIVAVGVVIYLLLPWILKVITHYTSGLYSGIGLFMR